MNKRKFPRIGHLPWSRGKTPDDYDAPISAINDWGIISITEKLDGENTVMGRDYYHARSIDSGGAGWRTMVAAIHAQINHLIPDNMRICGENMQGEHSIRYSLPVPFYVFSITIDDKVLSWKEMVDICVSFGLQTVPTIYCGPMITENDMHYAFKEYEKDVNREVEGYVIRNADEYAEMDWNENIMKYVREKHVKTDQHWTRNWKPNEIDGLWECEHEWTHDDWDPDIVFCAKCGRN